MSPAASVLQISPDQRDVLELIASTGTEGDRSVQCARALLLAAEGIPGTRIATEFGVSRTVVKSWCDRFAEEGLDALAAARAGRGRRPAISPAKVAAILHATAHEPPPDGKRWTCRTLAEAQGVSSATIQRIWASHEIHPNKTE